VGAAPDEEVKVLTPRSIVGAIRKGFEPQVAQKRSK
jgi:hypothetical protein